MDADRAFRVLQALPLGVLVVDEHLVVHLWNRWLEQHSGLPAEGVKGRALPDVFEGQEFASLRRKVRSVLSLGVQAFFDPGSDGHLLPFTVDDQIGRRLEIMRQSATISPLEGSDGRLVCVSISDETHTFLSADAMGRANDELETLNRTDRLTGTANRAHVLERLNVEVARLERMPGDLSVGVLDVDHFKLVNDQYGHLVGDEALRVVARALGASLRQVDLVGRFGGEEFLVIFVGAPPDGVMIAADRCRLAIEQAEIRAQGQRLHVTASLGVAHFEAGESVENLIRRADEALYRAKHEGRNRIVVAPPSGNTSPVFG